MGSEFDEYFARYGAPQYAAKRGVPVVLTFPDGRTRSVTGVVEHYPQRKMFDGAQAELPHKTLELQNDATAGISSDEFDRGGSILVTVPAEQGSSRTKTLGLYRPPPGLPADDGGMLLFDLR
jgi:hypothetical protein